MATASGSKRSKCHGAHEHEVYNTVNETAIFAPRAGRRLPAGTWKCRDEPSAGRTRATSTLKDRRLGAMATRVAKFRIGQIVRHRLFPFRGVIYDVDPEFNNTEEWYAAIPEEIRPRKDQPFYHLYAENEQTCYEAYVSEQNLLPDAENGPVRHPKVTESFGPVTDNGCYRLKSGQGGLTLN